MGKKQRKLVSDSTLALVNGAWALIVGSLMVWWIYSDLYPHLVSDGSLEGDLLVLGGSFAVAVILAVPSVFKTRFAAGLQAVKEWRGKDGDE